MKLTLNGGVPHHPSLVALWRDDRLTDFAVCAEGVEFKAHRVALASCSGYFLNLFESGMRDAADATHALQGISPAVLKVLPYLVTQTDTAACLDGKRFPLHRR